MNWLKWNKLKWSKFFAILILLSIFSVSTMPLTQVNAAEVCCDRMNKVTIRTPASSEYQTVTFICRQHGSVTPLEICFETKHYEHVMVQCKNCGAIWSNNRVYTGKLTHSNPHHSN